MIDFHTAQQSQAIDRFAIETAGIPGLLLMKRAGLFTFQTLQNHFSKAKRLLILCGSGNNGGDGLIVAQFALLAGLEVKLVMTGLPNNLKSDALLAYQELAQLGIEPSAFDTKLCEECDLIIDALFGIGLDREITGITADWIKQVNASGKPVISIDLPSGLHADTGRVLGVAVQATHTCTFLTRKPGLYQFEGSDFAGKIHFSTLFLDQDILNTQPAIAHNHSLKEWLKELPLRRKNSHKGSAGSLCLIGGDRHMMGAIQMAGLASLKVGTGLVKVITHPEHGIALTQALPELMCYPPEALDDVALNTRVIAIGPGLGLNDWGRQLFTQTVESPEFHSKAKVMDADALKWLAQFPQKQDNWVLTPHPGEAATLLDCTTQEVQQDRFSAIKTLQQKYGGVVVLKGNGTLVYDGKNMELCLAGNPGMAVGGMGDILTGTIGGLIAQGLPLFSAACLGVSLHAHAGDILAQQKGQLSLLPTELASILSQLLTYADSRS